MISRENVQVLIDDKSVSAYGIEKATGVPSSTIIKVRNGVRQLANLSQDTMEKLSHYYLQNYEPQRVFWDLKDKSNFMNWISKAPVEKWHIHIRASNVYEPSPYGQKNKLLFTEYLLEIGIEPFDESTEQLADKYVAKNKKIQDLSNIPIPLQPFYSDYQEVSYLSRKEMKVFIDRLRQVLELKKINYDDPLLESDIEAVLHRELNCWPLPQSYPDVDAYRGLNFRLEPIPKILGSIN